MNKSVIYSWVLPVRNEASSLFQLIEEISQAMRGKKWEVIAIDDASIDKTLTTLKALKNKTDQIKIIHFPSDHGKWAALREGFRQAKGEVVITIDSDLQDDPLEVTKLISKIEQGYDLVSGWRKNRFDPFYKVVISKLGNFLLSGMTNKKFNDLNSPFKVYKREVIENLPKEGSLLRFSLLFADKMGYKVTEIPITHRRRLYGKSKFGVVKYLRIIYDLFLALLLFSGSGRLIKK